jgi:hypothetical protein
MTIPTEDFSPRYVGDLSRPLSHTFTDHSGVVFSLAGVVAANMTFHMKNINSGTTKTGGGTWTIDDAANGVAHYTWVAGDVDTAGLWLIQAGVPFADGVLHYDVREIEFKTPL